MAVDSGSPNHEHLGTPTKAIDTVFSHPVFESVLQMEPLHAHHRCEGGGLGLPRALRASKSPFAGVGRACCFCWGRARVLFLLGSGGRIVLAGVVRVRVVFAGVVRT
eukprot:13072184-Alexandrium_andersonii.AAC.1